MMKKISVLMVMFQDIIVDFLDGAVVFGDRNQFLRGNPSQFPVCKPHQSLRERIRLVVHIPYRLVHHFQCLVLDAGPADFVDFLVSAFGSGVQAFQTQDRSFLLCVYGSGDDVLDFLQGFRMQPHSGADANLCAYWAILNTRIQMPALEELGETNPSHMDCACFPV